MVDWISRNFVRTMALGIALGATSAVAQDGSVSVGTERSWSIFAEDDPKECWVASEPKETVNTRNGQPAQVRRGETLMFVTYRPANGVAGEVSFTGGYTFAPDSLVTLKIGDDSFDLITEGEWAWAKDADTDARIVAAMKAGIDAVATGLSSRGTTTKDTFSLLGFTAATGAAAQSCAN